VLVSHLHGRNERVWQWTPAGGQAVQIHLASRAPTTRAVCRILCRRHSGARGPALSQSGLAALLLDPRYLCRFGQGRVKRLLLAPGQRSPWLGGEGPVVAAGGSIAAAAAIDFVPLARDPQVSCGGTPPGVRSTGSTALRTAGLLLRPRSLCGVSYCAAGASAAGWEFVPAPAPARVKVPRLALVGYHRHPYGQLRVGATVSGRIQRPTSEAVPAGVPGRRAADFEPHRPLRSLSLRPEAC
jgi:hypothetical protein